MTEQKTPEQRLMEIVNRYAHEGDRKKARKIIAKSAQVFADIAKDALIQEMLSDDAIQRVTGAILEATEGL